MTPAEWDARLVELVDALERGLLMGLSPDWQQSARALTRVERTALLTHARSRVEDVERKAFYAGATAVYDDMCVDYEARGLPEGAFARYGATHTEAGKPSEEER